MAATWSDFTLVGSTQGTTEGTLSVSNVQANDLIIAVSTARRSTGTCVAAPVHSPGGVSTDVIHEQNTIPAEIYPTPAWTWWWYPYWRYWWPYWYYSHWKKYAYRTVSRVTIYQARDNGTVQVTFNRGYSGSPIIKTYLCVWRPNVSVGQNETIKRIGFAPSAQAPTYAGYSSSIPVTADDLLLATAKGYPVTGIGLSISGVTVQNILSYSAYYGSSYDAIGLWRIKTSGTATVAYGYANVAQQLTKINPSVEVYHVSVPSIPPDAAYFYVEIGADLLSNGRVVRPRWFEAIRTTYAWSNSLGLRKRWLKETSLGSETNRGRLVELWKVPKGAESSIPGGEALVLTSDQDAEARVLMQDLGW